MTAIATKPTRYTVDDAAADQGIGRELLLAHIRSGDLPAIKPGRSWLVRPKDVEDLLIRLDEERREREAS